MPAGASRGVPWTCAGSEDAAWDVVSDTFTAAWRNWTRRPADDALPPWLYAITANAVSDHRRADDRQGRLVSRISMQRPEAPGPDLADGGYAPGNDPARNVKQVMAPLYSQLRCRSGSEPESAAAIAASCSAACSRPA